MVLHHVAQRADAIIIGDAAFEAHGFGDGDLDMVDRGGVPQRFEHDIAEAERQQVLDGFLAQIMVDAENLLFSEQVADAVVHDLGRGEILADRLFHRDPRPGRQQPGVGQPLCGRAEQRGRGGEIDGNAAFQASIDALGQLCEMGAVAGIDRLIEDHRAETRGDVGIIAVGRQELLERRADFLAKGLVIHFGAGRSDDQKVVGQQPVRQKIVERWENHAPGKIAGGTEQQERGRRFGQRTVLLR